jgi:hypothetical protein
MKEMKQGQRVEFKIGELKGKGKVVGKSMNYLPIIGATYIIEPDEPISNEVYDYSHFVANEKQITIL